MERQIVINHGEEQLAASIHYPAENKQGGAATALP